VVDPPGDARHGLVVRTAVRVLRWFRDVVGLARLGEIRQLHLGAITREMERVPYSIPY
jgi:hypothetical protein